MIVKKIIDKDNIIGSNIRRLRTERNIGQTQLVAKLQAEGIFIIRESLVRIESGKQNVKLDQLRAIKKILDVTWEDLLDIPTARPESEAESME